MLRRVSFSVSTRTRSVDADTMSASLMLLIFSRAASLSCFFASCLASHSALRFASASSWAFLLASSDASRGFPAGIVRSDISIVSSFTGGSDCACADGSSFAGACASACDFFSGSGDLSCPVCTVGAFFSGTDLC